MFIGYLIIGLLAGWIASKIVRGGEDRVSLSIWRLGL